MWFDGNKYKAVSWMDFDNITMDRSWGNRGDNILVVGHCDVNVQDGGRSGMGKVTVLAADDCMIWGKYIMLG